MKMETTVQNGSVIFTQGADQFTVTLHRTLRLPEDGQIHQLPPSLGAFPIKRVDDYLDKVPEAWKEHGGVFFPMWQREAMWLAFRANRRPFACKIAAGKINAISGKEWVKELAPSTGSTSDPRQDYCVAPKQRWIDGFNAGDGVVRQFVAMPLGQGYTVEGQVTGKEDFGGLQIMACAPKAGLLEPKPRNPGNYMGMMRSRKSNPTGAGGSSAGSPYGAGGSSYGAGVNYSCEASNISEHSVSTQAMPASAAFSTREVHDGAPSMNFLDSDLERSGSVLPKAAEMGLAQGGTMHQKIYPDPHGIDTWDVDGSGRMFIHIVNSEMYEQITGEKPPKSPITAHTYSQMGYPWYKLWEEEMGDIGSSDTLTGVKTVGQKDQQHGFVGQQNDAPIHEKKTVLVGHMVKDGTW